MLDTSWTPCSTWATTTRIQGDPTRAGEIWQQARELAFSSGNRARFAYVDVILGGSALERGDDALAAQLLGDALVGLGSEGDMHMQAAARELLARLALRQRRLQQGARLMRESLVAFRALAYEPSLSGALATTAALSAEGGEGACSARLLGAAAKLSASLELPVEPSEQAFTEQARHAARTTLGSRPYDAEFAVGHAYELETALDEALGALDRLSG